MSSNLVTITDPASPAAEAYRRLRVNLMSADRELPLRTVLIAAAGQDADKATVVANLAVTFARVGKEVILVDCDLRRPRLHTLFALENSAGVTTAVQDEKAPLPLLATSVPGLRLLPSGPSVDVPSDAVVPIVMPGFVTVLPNGTSVSAPSDLLASPAMSRLIGRLCDEADIVLFDAPPITLATDAAELATHVDGVLLTVVAGQTKRGDAQRAKELLAQVGARVVGAALVNVAVDTAVRKYAAG